ncbi:hypothetical protein BSK69_09495 [Pectobacterium actinidiae]|nr:hypothetical protein BSK69_09495 [Pectobacterium actinidiae]
MKGALSRVTSAYLSANVHNHEIVSGPPRAALKIAPGFYGGLSLPTALRAAASGVKNCSRQFFMFTMY